MFVHTQTYKYMLEKSYRHSVNEDALAPVIFWNLLVFVWTNTTSWRIKKKKNGKAVELCLKYLEITVIKLIARKNWVEKHFCLTILWLIVLYHHCLIMVLSQILTKHFILKECWERDVLPSQHSMWEPIVTLHQSAPLQFSVKYHLSNQLMQSIRGSF